MEVKWPIMITDLTWGKVIYGVLTAIRNSEKDLPIENTNAIFLLEPNKLKLQSKVKNLKEFY